MGKEDKLSVVGRLGADPDIRTSKAGSEYGQVNIAVNSRRKIKEEWKEDTIWVQLLAFDNKCDALKQFKRGAMVFASGGLKFEHYASKTGERKLQLKVMVDKIEPRVADKRDAQEGRKSEPSRANFNQMLKQAKESKELPF